MPGDCQQPQAPRAELLEAVIALLCVSGWQAPVQAAVWVRCGVKRSGAGITALVKSGSLLPLEVPKKGEDSRGN